MNPDVLFWFAAGGLFLTSLVSAGARSLRSFSRHDLEEIAQRSAVRQRFAEILRLHDRVALGVEHFQVLAVSFVLMASSWYAWQSWQDYAMLAKAELVMLVVVLALVATAAWIWLPWTVARLWAEPILFHAWRFWRFASALMTPLVWGAHLFDTLLHRLAGRTPEVATEETFEEEIRTIVTEGHREGLLEEDAREMIEGVMELHDADVAEVMTPRTDMHMLSAGMSWDEALEFVIQVRHTRIPVFNKNRDDVIGLLHTKDLLPELAKGPGETRRTIAELLRKPCFVPETKAVDDLLQEFQRTRNHMAVVLDEYGGVSGLVTIEDVLEEIVGEIVDEYDDDVVEEIQQVDPNTFEVLGRAHVDEVNERLGIDLPEDQDFDTIGGFVFSEMGHIPAPNESLKWNGQIRITVLEASRRRIDRLRIERLGENARESA